MQNHNIHCMSCQRKTDNHETKLYRTKNNRPILKAKCSQCGGGKTKFVSKPDFQSGQMGQGILGNLLKLPGGKIPFLGDLPLLGALF